MIAKFTTGPYHAILMEYNIIILYKYYLSTVNMKIFLRYVLRRDTKNLFVINNHLSGNNVEPQPIEAIPKSDNRVWKKIMSKLLFT